MGLTKFSSSDRVDFGLRFYHTAGEQSEMWAQMVAFDEVPQPTDSNLTVMHPDGTRFRIECTEEGLRVMVSGRHGGGMLTTQPYGNVVEIVNLHRDYCKAQLNSPMSDTEAYVSPDEIKRALEDA